MSLSITLPALFVWAAAVCAGVTSVAASRVRLQFAGGTYFLLMMIAVTYWCLLSGMEETAVGVAHKALLSQLDYVGICAVPPLYLEFAFAYSGRYQTSSLVHRALTLVVPAVTVALVFTNRWHHLIWTGVVPIPSPEGNAVIYRHGVMFWVWVLYAGVVSLVSTMVLVQTAVYSARLYRRQASTLLHAALLPWIGVILCLSPQSPLPGFDFTAVGFALSGGLVLVGIARFRLFDIVPVTRGQLIDRMNEGLLVLDAANRVVGLNQAARRIIGIGTEVIGRQVSGSLCAITELRGTADTREHSTSFFLPDEPGRRVDVTISPLREGHAGVGGRILVFRETVLNSEQVSANDLIPICASCRRVRGADGNWLGLERYVEKHFGKRFTHGLCEDCISNLYPELDVQREDPER